MQPANPANLAHDSDRSPVATGDALAPSGQLVLVGAAQLGLDGRAYAVASPEGRSPEPLLGTNAEFCTECKTELPAAKVWGGAAQLVLDLGDTKAIPQLDLFQRQRAQRYVLVKNLGREVAWKMNLHKCDWTRVPNRKGGVTTLYRDERGKWHHTGYVVCDQMCCAQCGPKEARSTAATLGVAFTGWLNGRRNDEGGCRDRPERLAHRDVWMLTLAPPHKMADEPGATVEKLFDAHARFKRSAAWRNFCREWGINSSVRVLDPTFGGRNGVHPHLHIALFVERARDQDLDALVEQDADGQWKASEFRLGRWRAHRSMTLDERKQRCREIGSVLWSAWHDAMRAAGVEHMITGEALELSPGEKAAAYFTGWGLADEVGGSTAKNRSHLRLLDAAAVGIEGAGAMYVGWVAATHGKQWVTGLGDLRARLDISDEDIEHHVAQIHAARDAAARERNEVIREWRPLQVDIAAALHEAALALGWTEVHAICNDADARDVPVQLALVDALCAERRRLELLRTRAPP